MSSTSMFWCVLFAFALGYGSSIDSCMDLDSYLCCTEDNDIYMNDTCNCTCMCEDSFTIFCTCTSENFTCNCTSDNCTDSTDSTESSTTTDSTDSSTTTDSTDSSTATDSTDSSTATDSSTSPSPNSSSSPSSSSLQLDTLHYLGIAAGGAFLLIVSIIVCICICTVCIIKGSKSTKAKELDGSAVRLSEEGKVQLLGIADKAGVEDADTSGKPPEAVQTEQSPAEAAAETAAETAADLKEDDKRVVTVATFGFPEVAILPPPATEEEAEAKETEVKEPEAKVKGHEAKEAEVKEPEAKEAEVKEAEAKEDSTEKKEVQKDTKEEGISADSGGPGTPAATKETRGKTPEAEHVLDQADTPINLEKNEAGMELGTQGSKATTTAHVEASPQKTGDASLAKTETASLPLKTDTAQVSPPKTNEISLPIADEVVKLENTSTPSQQHDVKLGAQLFEMGPDMESLILSQEAIEKALGLDISTQL